MNIEMPLDRIEFHERPSGVRIEVRFYADKGKLKELLEFCAGEKWRDSEWSFMLRRFECSQARNPKYRMYVGHMIDIYPKEEYIADFNAGLHYICQHSFDIFDYCRYREVKDWFYDTFAKNEIGYLYTKKGEKYLVRSDDIDIGFMLSRETCDEFKDSFTNWIKYRNLEREKKQS